MLENKLNIENQLLLNKEEERLSKLRAKELYESGKIDPLAVGTFASLSFIHHFLFQDIYSFVGERRSVNIS